jgi:hypothetical protein
MAATKAKATYAVTTLSLLTKVMGKPPLVHVAARITLNLADRSTAKKSALLSLRDISNARNRRQRG